MSIPRRCEPGKLRVLALSDIHYPLTDEASLCRIIDEEKADKVVFLGDCVKEDQDVPGFLDIVQGTRGSRDVVFIRGDEDSESLPSVNSFELYLGRNRFVFMHGNQFDVGTEGLTAKLASLLHKINGGLPALAYATVARTRTGAIRKPTEHLLLGHCHALVYFPRLRVACTGCLTSAKNIYNDLGYVVIESDSAGGVNLLVRSLRDNGTAIFRISN